MVAPMAYGNSLARDWIRATAVTHTGSFHPLRRVGEGTCTSTATRTTIVRVFFFFFFFFCLFLGLHLQHLQVPRLGVESELCFGSLDPHQFYWDFWGPWERAAPCAGGSWWWGGWLEFFWIWGILERTEFIGTFGWADDGQMQVHERLFILEPNTSKPDVCLTEASPNIFCVCVFCFFF